MTGIAFATPTFLPPAGAGLASARAEGFPPAETFDAVLDRVQGADESAPPARPRTNSPVSALVSRRTGPGVPGELVATPTETETQVPSMESGAGHEDVLLPVALPPATNRGAEPGALVVQAPEPGGAPAESVAEATLVATDDDAAEPEANDLKKPVFAPASAEERTANATGTEVAGEPAEAEAEEAEPLHELKTVAAPVEIIIPLQPAISRPVIETATNTDVVAPKLGVPSRATPASPELMPVPEAAVQLRIKAPSEPGGDIGEVASIAQPAAVASRPVQRTQSEPSNSPVIRTGDEEVPAIPEPNNAPTESNVRIPSGSHLATGRDAAASGGDRHSETREHSLLALEPAGEPIQELDRTESVAAPVVTPRLSSAPGHMPARETAPARPIPADMIPPEPMPKAPLKSISLEFSPGGSADVQLKLSERAGEVHVSLHSSDANLNHQLRHGIGDLAHALAGAGYEAEAWTSQERGDRRQREHYQPAEPPQRKAGTFQTALNESPQEVL